jgi:coenzyme F420 hydrogenase subunit beta
MNLLNMVQENASEIKPYSKVGFFIGAYSARTKIKEISEKCQDGGISSTCLYYLFDSSKIDYALGAKMSENLWRPEPLLLKNKEDILLTTGTKYVNNPNLSLLNKVNGDSHKLAVVGVPCMMQALLKSKIYDLNIPSQNNVIYRIGIFCMESFSYESFLKICEMLNVNVNDVKKSDINKGKFFVYTNKGDELNIPIKDITHLAREDCEVCYDLTSESADISIGSIGSPSGWNTVLVRTQKGKELYDALIKNDLIESKSLDAVKPGLPLLEKIADSKKKKCSTHIAKKESEQIRTPSY